MDLCSPGNLQDILPNVSCQTTIQNAFFVCYKSPTTNKQVYLLLSSLIRGDDVGYHYIGFSCKFKEEHKSEMLCLAMPVYHNTSPRSFFVACVSVANVIEWNKTMIFLQKFNPLYVDVGHTSETGGAAPTVHSFNIHRLINHKVPPSHRIATIITILQTRGKKNKYIEKRRTKMQDSSTFFRIPNAVMSRFFRYLHTLRFVKHESYIEGTDGRE